VVVERAADSRGCPGRRRGTRLFLAPAALALGSAALVLLVVAGGEWLARVLSPDYLTRKRGLHVYSETYGWAPRPGTSTTIAGTRVSFNARGYRGRELAVPREPGPVRLVVLGDSVAFGLDVSDEQTFTHLIDARDNGIEAGNLAVQGYGPGQALLRLEEEGLRADPDVVVLSFCLANDFVDATLETSLYHGAPKPRFHLAGDRLELEESGLRQSPARAALQWLADYSHLFNRASALAPDPGEPPGLHWRYRRREALQDAGYALRLSSALIHSMDALCRERGVRFLVATFPSQSSYRAKSDLEQRLVEALERDGIPVVDMAARFEALGLRFDDIALDAAGHLSPRGHRVVSRILLGEVASRVAGAGRELADVGGRDLSSR
jgi:hypothetical protein